MIDHEKVKKGLECCLHSSKSHCDECPYIYESLCNINYCTADLASDVLALLKENPDIIGHATIKEPRAPHYTHLQYSINGIVHEIKHPECPRCFENGLNLWRAEIKKGQAYCNRCGQEVKWNDD